MTYDITFEVREDRAREWMDTLSDHLSEYYTDISGAQMTLEGLDITEVWGVLSVIAEYAVPIKHLVVEEREA